MVTFSGVAHVAVVVRDLEASVAWYRRALGFEPVGGVSSGPPGEGHPRQLLRHPSGVVLGVHEPLDRSGDAFDPSRTGLDHVALRVDGPDALEGWSRHLDQMGVDHSPVRDAEGARLVSVFDPDGMQWELWAPDEGA